MVIAEPAPELTRDQQQGGGGGDDWWVAPPALISDRDAARGFGDVDNILWQSDCVAHHVV